MISRAIVALTLFAAASVLPARSAFAELPPGSYDKLRIEAEEALIVEVVSVKTKEIGVGRMEVVLEAKIVAAQRSKAGLKKGGKITIRYQSLDRTKVTEPGPRPIPVLGVGDFYPAFLNKARETPGFEPAAYGESFLMTPES